MAPRIETTPPSPPMALLTRALQLLRLPVAGVLVAMVLANVLQAFFFPLELELREGTVWLHVLAAQAGMPLYDHAQVAFVNMNHGPMDPLLKQAIATVAPFLSPAMVTRFFVLLLPGALFLALRAASPGQPFRALLSAAGLELFLLGLQPPNFLIGRSDPTALFFLALLLTTAAGPLARAAPLTARWFGWVVVGGVLGGVTVLTNWRLAPGVAIVGAGFALEGSWTSPGAGRAPYFVRYAAGVLLGGLMLFSLIFFGIFDGDWVRYFHHFFGFFSAESGWGAGRDERFLLAPHGLLRAHWLTHMSMLALLVLGLVFPSRQTPRLLQLLGWIPLLGLFWLSTCLAYFLNRSGGGIWYFGGFYVVFAFHLVRAVDWNRLRTGWSIALPAGILLGLPWQETWSQARRLTDSFAPATAFLRTARALAGGERIHSEDYYFFKTRYEGETIDIGDSVHEISTTGYFGSAFDATACRYFVQLQSSPPRFVISGGTISPALKTLLATSYRPVLRIPPAGVSYAGPPQIFYELRQQHPDLTAPHKVHP